jgi:hypothetical protein
VSLYDHIPPSERAAELGLVVKRLRRHTGLDIVPMLVVEGPSDEAVFGAICCHGARNVFPAGTRDLVEQLLIHLTADPLSGCDCVFLVDCDGRGKTATLSSRNELVVTEACDLEADLVTLGVAWRVTRRFVSADDAATSLVGRACDLAMPLSVVRRAAHGVHVSMKRRGRQLRFNELPELHLSAWTEQSPTDAQVVDVVASELGWWQGSIDDVNRSTATVSRQFAHTCLGKDVLDALYRLLVFEATGEVRGWDCDYFHRAVHAELAPRDLPAWEVGRRIYDWQDASGHTLLET